MACMCGDTYCSSCGPAQGNYRCGVCGAWDHDGGCEDPDACEAKGEVLAEQEAHSEAVMTLAEELAWSEGVWIGELSKPKEWWAKLEAMKTHELWDKITEVRHANFEKNQKKN